MRERSWSVERSRRELRDALAAYASLWAVASSADPLCLGTRPAASTLYVAT
ncbi:hypothetical protein SPRG_15610 [Saprolegnia parasitica CBS 223.65]|uniref:Uncharacterized protein n=1 Tax=Saprolegnia parasitica (strain CBS 223.65) TaxID=695850 RepID=A0A067BE15_SAPPC|nr:hypothetical protein SPRG_15610 [Saprolegnia parasitica CBS 223.65]KDO16604.1 hypothetical protein SPRG_15610 [Saprolegnia parasitica CBS 223.65]|eukprot:XP_012212689.1 hypothetical protein SPRG_15610 [Saprolegnia parasitica CBS 223.65]